LTADAQAPHADHKDAANAPCFDLLRQEAPAVPQTTNSDVSSSSEFVDSVENNGGEVYY